LVFFAFVVHVCDLIKKMEAAGQVVRSGAELLAAERKGASFPVRDLTLLLDPATPRRVRRTAFFHFT
jgi:hypothetical protein